MTIELIIKGDHVTDVLSQIALLSDATRGGNNIGNVKAVEDTQTPPSNQITVEETNKLATEAMEAAKTELPVEGETEVEETKLYPAAKQKKIVDDVIKTGVIADGDMERLGPRNQKKAQKAIDEKVEAENAVQEQAEILDGDDEAQFDKNDLRMLMVDYGNNPETGQPDMERMSQMKKIITAHTPEGVKPSVKTLDDSKVTAVYVEIKALKDGE